MQVIVDPAHSFTLGGLPLVADGLPVYHDEGFTTEVSEGTTWGNPEIVASSLISALSDGDIVRQSRAGNREVVLYVRVTGDTHAGLVAGDSALSAVVGKPVELVWNPPDAEAPPTVVDVVHSRMDHHEDEWDLNRRLSRRTWVITLSALPWPRSATKIASPAVAAVTPTVVDDGSSTTNWSADGTLSTSSGAVVNTYPAPPANGIIAPPETVQHALVRAFPTPLVTTDKFVAFDWQSTIAPSAVQVLLDDGAFLNEVRREPAPTAGFTRSWFQIPAANTSVPSLHLSIEHVTNKSTASIRVDQVLRANALPVVGTTKQKVAVVSPGGNVTAEGDVIVEHATAGLGVTVAYSHPIAGGASPPLRQWLHLSDPVTADANTVSGATNPISNLCIYSIPTPSTPRGDVHLWARLHANAAGSLIVYWAAETWVGDAMVGARQDGGTLVTWAAANTWVMAPLARLTLPTGSVGPASTNRISLQRQTSTTVVSVDDSYLYAMNEGRLTVIDCGIGGPAAGTVANRLKISAPSLEQPFGSIMLATAADFSDAWTPVSAKVGCDQTGHRFDPGGSAIFTVTAGAFDAAVSLEHYPRFRAEAS